jgi:Retroviral aspartyl protease
VSVKEDAWILPKPIVVQVRINGYPAQALIDSRSLGDFMSSTLADQLKVRRETSSALLGLQLAVQGSQSKINTTTMARMQYQGIDAAQHFDIILETPWLYQHKVCIGLNQAHIIIGCNDPDLIQQGQDTKLMLHALDTDKHTIEAARLELQWQVEPLCHDVDKMDLPPF